MTPPTAKPPVHLVCAGNAAFNMPMSVMLTSAVENFDPNRELHIHILSLDSGEREREMVRRSVENVRPGLTNVVIEWPVMNLAWFEGLPNAGRFGRDTFSRLFAPELLPADCEKFLYLDCDMIVLADLGELLDNATAGTTVHACVDVLSGRADTRFGIFNHVELGIPPDAPLFNAGMMIVDVKRWRETSLASKVIDYIRQHTDNTYNDQTALNAYLYKDWTQVDPRWNQFDIVYPMAWEWAGHSHQTYVRARDYPCIVHYTGQVKPWHCKNWRPRYAFFFRYLEKSAYRGTLPSQSLRLEMLIGAKAYVRLWMFSVLTLRKVRQWVTGWHIAKPRLEVVR